MASSNGKGKPVLDVIGLLHRYEAMMELMINNGVTYRTFKEHSLSLYVQQAVRLSGDNYSEAARKIGLHHNHVRAIMHKARGREYAEQVVAAQSGEPHTE